MLQAPARFLFPVRRPLAVRLRRRSRWFRPLLLVAQPGLAVWLRRTEPELQRRVLPWPRRPMGFGLCRLDLRNCGFFGGDRFGLGEGRLHSTLFFWIFGLFIYFFGRECSVLWRLSGLRSGFDLAVVPEEAGDSAQRKLESPAPPRECWFFHRCFPGRLGRDLSRGSSRRLFVQVLKRPQKTPFPARCWKNVAQGLKPVHILQPIWHD